MAWTKRQGSVQLLDGSNATIGTPADIGNAQFSGLQEGGAEAVRLKQRGAHVGAVEGDDTEVSFSFDVHLPRASLTDAANFRIWDAIHKTGAVAGSTNDNPIGSTAPWMCRLVYTLTKGGVTASFKLKQCRLTASISEDGDAVIMSVEGTGIQDMSAVT